MNLLQVNYRLTKEQNNNREESNVIKRDIYIKPTNTQSIVHKYIQMRLYENRFEVDKNKNNTDRGDILTNTRWSYACHSLLTTRNESKNSSLHSLCKFMNHIKRNSTNLT